MRKPFLETRLEKDTRGFPRCSDCEGTGRVYETGTCRNCNGKGFQTENDRRRNLRRFEEEMKLGEELFLPRRDTDRILRRSETSLMRASSCAGESVSKWKAKTVILGASHERKIRGQTGRSGTED